MGGENNLIFSEVQKFGLWLRVPLAALTIFVIGLSIAAFRTMVSEGGFSITAVILNIVIGICVPAAVSVLFFTARMETQVRPDGLYVRFFPFHLHFKKFGKEDLGQYYARQYRPLLEYGGWGIRYGSKGKAYNVSGNKGLQLVFTNGKKLLVGSQKADELAEAVESIMKGT